MKIGINGTGRIGRLLLRRAFDNIHGLDIAVINTVSPVETLVHLLQYDTVHGKWNAVIEIEQDHIIINGKRIRITSSRNPELIGWDKYGVDIVVDATGKFNDRVGASRHLESGASRVIITAPGKEMDLTVVMGVNESDYDPEKHFLLSTASCTTNCLAPVLQVLDQAFQVQSGWMTTIHSYTNDQHHLDNSHPDLRRARACTQSIIPTSTGVQKALKDVLPHLAPKMRGTSLRVPTQDVSIIDLTVQLGRSVTVEEVKEAFLQAIDGSDSIGRFIDWSDQPLVSTDYVGNDKSAIVDALSTIVMGNELKLLAWYDNEWGYACRVIDFVNYLKSCELLAIPDSRRLILDEMYTASKTMEV
ncbi:type I glyceraldehyde-3-phosphate dehydrogenase [Paenibacillus eucommiae]|uniref:Glyceraldehyde-3-phosphate dehydrogenase n=1 Tax=Paenibacillus eucommiae TaxID=1355755 RepID=A0ABS4J0L9_9BACL|nr:type I glyceraldehyde-3-phosphate dehydrogenase [Paenibacillus eucommiae]MBP1993382.1 glyceraldehyde 3-phosphate dehydrogenase [Paenibacillus eucommiae]